MNEKELLNQLFDELFPIMRSITGPGFRKSIDIFNRYMPLKKTKFPTGKKIFDWTVPYEWNFKRAKLIDPEGNVICDTKVNNLHVVNYSEPVDLNIPLEELENHLFSIPELPTAIPYVTSYYKKTWGFCLSHNDRLKLQPGKYRATIDTEFIKGGVTLAECYLKGESSKEILITSYLCHPSLANNELSGPLALLAIYNRIKKWNKRRYSYRFLINPETIGALCFLYDNAKILKQNLVSGFTLTCLGGPSQSLRYKSSRFQESLVNNVFNYNNKITSMPIEVVPFTPFGSDERQYCSPGFNLPMGQISRTTYGKYDGYHNSLDTKDFMGIDNVIESVETIEQILKYIEVCGNPVNLKPFGEPQLGKRNLYPNINSEETRKNNSDDEVLDGRTKLNRILLLLNLADGEKSLIDIANKARCSVDDLIPSLLILEERELIKYNVKKPKL